MILEIVTCVYKYKIYKYMQYAWAEHGFKINVMYK